MAPVSEIQTRNNYAPWLSEGTKLLKEERSAAQDKAASTDDPEDWRQYRSIRTQVTAMGRADKAAWEKQKLDHTGKSSDLWKQSRVGLIG